ncbi:hypothetical protein [Piscibacillus halophilus]|uniref:hypothetical protein n=1 Tax=Piscibacillus halophilus TaxID=571933 RepID=UPI00158DEC70|nr:hypothetical protein [Piscibacillus halophilus]
MKVKLILLLLVMVFVLSGCFNSQGSNETEIIREKINEEMEFSPYIPHMDYPIGSVVIEYNYKR